MPTCYRCGSLYHEGIVHHCPTGIGANPEHMLMMTTPPDRYAEGYKAGRIAALREVGCQYGCARYADKRNYCSRCRLLAEAESGKDTAEVGE